MNEELAAMLKAVSRILDGEPDQETIFGVQLILEHLADGPVAPSELAKTA